ncbi:MAG: hypothetical protein COC14_00065 [Burkholderiaceae bacterium]|nr:MAG: hypothetical protein COC14_00065 [Burkholderiaceae bacterium]
MLPNRVKLSTKSTDKFRYLKSKTGLTPNILARIAMMLALKEGSNLSNAGVADNDGQDLNKSVLFGEHEDVYDVMINQYLYEHDVDMDVQQAIVALIEVGVHKMGHLKSIEEIYKLT